MYQRAVCLYLEYGSIIWSATAKTNQQVLDKVQYQAIGIITGFMRSTPVKATKTTAVVEPLSQRRDARTAESLHEVAQHRRVVPQWVSAHCGLTGNEKVDELAKLVPKEGSKTTASPSKKRRDPHQSASRINTLRRITSASSVGGSKLWS